MVYQFQPATYGDIRQDSRTPRSRYKRTVEDNRKDDTVNVPVNDTVKLPQLTERQKKIYHIIKDGTINDTINVPINTSGLATMFNVSEKTIKRDLYVLRDLNLIKYIGSNKTGHWEAAQ